MSRILEYHELINWHQFSVVPLFCVRYAGDVATDTPDTWQIWTQDQIDLVEERVPCTCGFNLDPGDCALCNAQAK